MIDSMCEVEQIEIDQIQDTLSNAATGAGPQSGMADLGQIYGNESPGRQEIDIRFDVPCGKVSQIMGILNLLAAAIRIIINLTHRRDSTSYWSDNSNDNTLNISAVCTYCAHSYSWSCLAWRYQEQASTLFLRHMLSVPPKAVTVTIHVNIGGIQRAVHMTDEL